MRGLSRILSVSLLVGGIGAVPARAACDATPPDLADFSFAPSALDVTAAPGQTTCTVAATDDLAGVSEVTCSFRSPTFLQSHSCTATTPASGTSRDGTWRCAVTIPQYSDAGTWKESVTLTDGVGNARSVSEFELPLLGFPTDLAVTSVPDLSPPVLTAFSFAPSAVDASAADRSVTCSMTFTDSPAGVAQATCQFQSPDAFQVRSCPATAPASGTPTSGTWQCTVTIPRYADAGTWQAYVLAGDTVGNMTFLDPTTLAASGFPTDLAVTAVPEDVVGPSLTGFDFDPKTLDLSGSGAVVTCSMAVTDALSGAWFAACVFTSPSQLQSFGCGALDSVSGTRQNGTFRCDVAMPQYAEGGIWKAAVSIQDLAGNFTSLADTDLATAGFPTDLDVACGGADTPFLRWDDGTTLAWDAIAGAIRYDVYRGALSAIPAEYGACQNSRDPDPTDTTFTETDAPSPGEGYQFLVSVTTAGGEGPLGTATDGTPRTVTSSCP